MTVWYGHQFWSKGAGKFQVSCFLGLVLTKSTFVNTVNLSHSWAQRKLSPLSSLSPLNILLLINGPLTSLGFNGLND